MRARRCRRGRARRRARDRRCVPGPARSPDPVSGARAAGGRTRASARGTAGVAGLAVVIAIALGPVDQGLFAAQHVVQVSSSSRAGCSRSPPQSARALRARERATQAALAGERAARIEANIVARASELLATALNPEERLAQVVALAVPELADVATVDLLQPDGTLSGGAAEPPSPASPRRWSRRGASGRSTRRATTRPRSRRGPAARSCSP